MYYVSFYLSDTSEKIFLISALTALLTNTHATGCSVERSGHCKEKKIKEKAYTMKNSAGFC
jgi:hypothetical protein